MLQLWDTLLPLVKDLKVRFGLAMLGNVLVLWFLVTFFKKFIPDLPSDLIS